MKKLCFQILSVLLLCGSLTAQNNKTINKDKRSVNDNNNLTSATSNKPSNESAYFGFEHRIIEFSVSNSIPEGFPTKDGFKSRELYKDAINKWMKENEVFIKPEYKNKTITD
jgi:hypothetical protein